MADTLRWVVPPKRKLVGEAVKLWRARGPVPPLAETWSDAIPDAVFPRASVTVTEMVKAPVAVGVQTRWLELDDAQPAGSPL